MKRVFLLLMITGVLFLTSCSRKAREQSEEEKETITVSVMTPLYSDDGLQDVLKQKYPEIRLEFFGYPEEQYYTVLKSRLAIGKSADILDIQLGYAGPNGVEEIGPAGYLLPLYEVPDGPQEFYLLALHCSVDACSLDAAAPHLDLLCLEDGCFDAAGAWQPGRRLNGDEVALMDYGAPTLLHARVLLYD